MSAPRPSKLSFRSEDRPIIERVYGAWRHHSLPLTYSVWNDPKGRVKPEYLKEFDLPPEERKLKFLACLEEEIGRLKDLHKELKELSRLEVEVEQESCDVPEAPRLDRLLRYSASLERDFDRTLNQLERLQRTRKGQPVPPTLNVNLSR